MQTWLKVTGIATAITVTTVLTSPLWLPIDTLWQQVADQIKQQTGRDIYVDGAKEFSLMPTLAIELEQVRLSNVVGGTARDMLTVQQLRLEMPWRFLWTRQFELEQFVLIEPVLHLEKNRKGEANWQFTGTTDAKALDGKATDPKATAPNATQGSTVVADAKTPATKAADTKTSDTTTADSKAAEAAIKEAAATVTDAVASQAAARGYDLKLGQVQIKNGQISYQDAKDTKYWAVEELELALQMPSLQGAAKAQGQLTYQGQPVQLSVELNSPAALMADQPASIKVQLENKLVKASLDGAYQVEHPTEKQAIAAFAGKLQTEGSSLRAVQAWLKGETLSNYDASTLGKFSINGDVTATPVRLGINNMLASVDSMELKGNLTLKTGAQPILLGELTTNLLDVTPYLPKAVAPTPATSTAAESSAGESAAAANATAAEPVDASTSKTMVAATPLWNKAPLDLSALQQLDADIKLQSPGLVFNQLKLGETNWHLTNKQGKLKAQLKKFSAYDGTGQGALEINAQQTPYKLQSSMTFSNINAEPLLNDAIGLDKLLGKGNVNWQLSSTGVSQADFVQALQGQLSTSLKDGAVRGANIAAMVRSVQEALTGNLQGVDFDKDFQKSEQTDFAELSANFTLSNGIASNKDLNLQSPLLRLTGNGTVDIPNQQIDFLLQPKLVASLEGQGSKKAKKGINIPIRVNGPWQTVKFRPDVSQAAKKKAKDKVKKKVTDKAKQLLKTGG